MKNRKIVSIICVILALLMILTVVLGALSSSAWAVSQAQIDALEEQKAIFRSQRAKMQLSIDELEAEKADVLIQKAALDEKNEIARQEIELINEQIDLYTQLIEEKARELDKAREVEEEQFESYRSHVRAMEENGKFTYLAIIFNSRSLSELLYNIDMVAEIMDADKRLYDSYTAARENTERIKAEYENTLAELGGKLTELEDEKAELEEQIASAVQIIKDLENDIEEYKKQYEAAQASEDAVQAQIANLAAQLKAQEEEARRQQQLLQQQQQQQQGGSQQTPTYTGPGANATGSLGWPCPSSTYVTSKFGPRIHPLFGEQRPHTGVDISAANGASIVAADGGTVATAATNNSYGNYVVLYHTGGMTTLYAHMSSMAVSSGQSVSKGDVIGYVGETGWTTGPHLHFEVSLNGTRVNPLNYYSNYSLAPDA